MTGEISKPSAISINDRSSMKLPPSINGAHHKNKNKKKGDAFGLLKAAVFKLRQRPSEKPKPTDHHQTDHDHVDSERKWNKLFGSMRPPSSPPPSARAMSLSPSVESLEDLATPDSPPTSIASNGTMSQYASANNLQELDKHEDNDHGEDDPDEVFDAITGDEMIDAKAELFIAQFYQEMKLQQSNRRHRHHHHKGKDKVRK